MKGRKLGEKVNAEDSIFYVTYSRARERDKETNTRNRVAVFRCCICIPSFLRGFRIAALGDILG